MIFGTATLAIGRRPLPLAFCWRFHQRTTPNASRCAKVNSTSVGNGTLPAHPCGAHLSRLLRGPIPRRSDRPGAVEARRLTDLQNPGTSSISQSKRQHAQSASRRRRVNEARGRIAVGGAVGSFACSGPTLLCRYYSSRKRVGHIDRSNPRALPPCRTEAYKEHGQKLFRGMQRNAARCHRLRSRSCKK